MSEGSTTSARTQSSVYSPAGTSDHVTETPWVVHDTSATYCASSRGAVTLPSPSRTLPIVARSEPQSSARPAPGTSLMVTSLSSEVVAGARITDMVLVCVLSSHHMYLLGSVRSTAQSWVQGPTVGRSTRRTWSPTWKSRWTFSSVVCAIYWVEKWQVPCTSTGWLRT